MFYWRHAACYISVPARHISEGPALTVLRPARLYSALPELKKKKINYNFFFLQIVFVFSNRGVKMLAKCLQICAHVFVDRPQNCAQASFRSYAGLRPNFDHPRSRLCPISFAPCPFPNLAGTLYVMVSVVAVGFLLCQQQLASAEGQRLWRQALGGSFVVSLCRDEVLHMHVFIINYYETIKGWVLAAGA